MSVAKNDDVIQTFSPYAPKKAFLPGIMRGDLAAVRTTFIAAPFTTRSNSIPNLAHSLRNYARLRLKRQAANSNTDNPMPNKVTI